MSTMTSVRANGVELGVETFGRDDDPLVLLAGGPTMLSWPDSVCERLAAGGRRVGRYGLRDCGASTAVDPEAPGSHLRDLAADAAVLVGTLGAVTAHLGGVGVGGMVAQVAALDHSNAFSALTLVSTRPVALGPVDDDLPDHDAATMGAVFSRPMPDWTDRSAVAAFAADGAELLGTDPEQARDRGTDLGPHTVERTLGAASHQHLSPSNSGYSPICTWPFRWAANTSGVSGRKSASSCLMPLRQPPRTAGTQPPLPVRALSYRIAYTSVRAAKSAPKNATFASGDDPSSTMPGFASKNAACAGPGGAACFEVILSSRSSRVLSARSRASSASTAAGISVTMTSYPPTTTGRHAHVERMGGAGDIGVRHADVRAQSASADDRRESIGARLQPHAGAPTSAGVRTCPANRQPTPTSATPDRFRPCAARLSRA
jgi:pimeloyl-ACP methyl ester carboxylesterase